MSLRLICAGIVVSVLVAEVGPDVARMLGKEIREVDPHFHSEGLFPSGDGMTLLYYAHTT